MKYLPGKETAAEFLDRFKDIIRSYKSIPNVSELPETEIRDAFYNAINKGVPQVQNLEFVTFNITGKGLSYEELKRFIIQHKASRKTMPVNVEGTRGAGAMLTRPDYCYNCHDSGHYAKYCPRPDSDLKKCYNCLEFTNHKAAQCREERGDLRLRGED